MSLSACRHALLPGFRPFDCMARSVLRPLQICQSEVALVSTRISQAEHMRVCLMQLPVRVVRAGQHATLAVHPDSPSMPDAAPAASPGTIPCEAAEPGGHRRAEELRASQASSAPDLHQAARPTEECDVFREHRAPEGRAAAPEQGAAALAQPAPHHTRQLGTGNGAAAAQQGGDGAAAAQQAASEAFCGGVGEEGFGVGSTGLEAADPGEFGGLQVTWAAEGTRWALRAKSAPSLVTTSAPNARKVGLARASLEVGTRISCSVQAMLLCWMQSVTCLFRRNEAARVVAARHTWARKLRGGGNLGSLCAYLVHACRC